ncbi:hypothetical protein C8R46DRAFT_1342808 [Mycena filopes]|nr:hypothetical protein C8R46DRAFT_1342808 [Mycena filopes]
MQTPATNVLKPISPRAAAQLRLLYRGALSLPDSHLLLDGLTFVARLEHPPSGHNLLKNPLTLALESMRKRPSLRWMGPTKLDSIYLDEAGGISMDVHPNATITRIYYFENTFCLEASLDFGIKVALGDSDGPETTEMVILARPQANGELQLVIARITPAPPPPSLLRLPRPDDPTPRRPPIRFDRSSSVGSNPLVRKRTTSVANLGSSVRPDSFDSGAFKIPDIPRSVKREEVPDEDVFEQGVVEDKGKRKHAALDVESEVESQMEKANKTIIKQSTIHLLPISKTHPEYKDIYGFVYRGVLFALRGEIKRSAVDLKSVERLVKIHVNMYVSSDARK